MEGREAKEFLMRGWNIEKEIAALEEEWRCAWEAAVRIVKMPGEISVQESRKVPADEKFAVYADYTRTIAEKVKELIKVKREIIEAISRVENGTYRAILYERYIRYKKWERIATEMGYDYRYMRRLHGRALQQIMVPTKK